MLEERLNHLHWINIIEDDLVNHCLHVPISSTHKSKKGGKSSRKENIIS